MKFSFPFILENVSESQRDGLLPFLALVHAFGAPSFLRDFFHSYVFSTDISTDP